MVRLAGEEKEPLLEAYTDDIESLKTNPNADPVAPEEPCAADAARRCRRRRRFFHFLAFTLLALVFIGVRHYKRWGKTNLSRLFPEDEPHKLPIVPGVTLEHCTNWKGDQEDDGDGAAVFKGEDGYYIPSRPMRLIAVRKPFSVGSPEIQVIKTESQPITSSAEFSLDADKPLFFVSRGGFSHGHITVRQSEDESTDVKTTVTVTTDGQDDSGHWHEHFLDVVRVCKIKKDGDDEATGVGIFTPEWRRRGPHKCRRHHKVNFLVTVELPKSKDPLEIESLVTDMPIFSQALLTKSEAVSFESLHLNGAFAQIYALDAAGKNVTVHNSNAAIEGSFKASNLVVLQTENAHIDVSLELENANATKPTRASLLTTNARIISKNTLTATDWSEDNTGNFSVFAGTKHARIQLTFPSAPVNSTLDLTADTALGSVDAALHPTYEGEFFLTTSLAKAELLLSADEADPERRDRKRSALTHPMRSEVYGETWWGNYQGKQKHWGNVKLKTALSSVTLRFNGTDV